MWRLVGGEVRHQASTWIVRPAIPIVLAGLAAAMGVHVALGTAYPGPVAPVLLRWTLTAVAVLAAVGLARTAPSTWRQLRRSWRRARVGVAAVLLAGVVSLVKVGLHDTTPGPVLPAAGRWVAVAVLVMVVVAAIMRDEASS